MKVKFSERFEKGDTALKIILIYAVLIVMCMIAIYPMLNVLSISLRPGASLFTTSLDIIPEDATLENYRVALFEKDLLLWIKNSLLISISTGLLGVVFSATAGYAFSRFRFYGRKTGMMMFLVTQMFPAPMLLLPMYILLTKLGLINHFWGLLIPYMSTAVPFSVWLLKGYFDTIPISLEESAYIDGSGVLSTFWKIVVPLASPALAIAGLFAFMSAWSEYIVARIILTNKDIITLPVGLVQLQGQFSTEWGVYSAAAILTTIPVMVLFISLSRYLVGGLTLGGVKG